MKIGYLVNSHVSYYLESLPRLILSMNKSGIPTLDIHIYVGGSDVDASDTFMGCTIYFVKHNSYDYTTFIEWTKNPVKEYDAVFYLHDTCEVEESFKNLVEINYDSLYEVMYCTIKHVGICNIGMYRSDYLYSLRKKFEFLKDCDKNTAVLWEGFAIKESNSKKCYPDENIENSQIEVIYKDGVLRKIEHYKHLGLKKYKANWEMKKEWTVNL